MTKVDWKKLKHAQGPATRVPNQILDLAKPGHPSDAASHQLTEALVVEGKWLPTSVPAAELLVEQLTRKGAKPTPAALRLLGDLAAGDHLWFLRPEAPAKRAKDNVAQATLEVARGALPLATKWLSAAEPERRAVAAFFLALVEQDARSAFAIAKLANGDPVPEVRGGAALALGFYARGGDAESRDALVELDGDLFSRAGRWAGKVVEGSSQASSVPDALDGWLQRWEPPLLPWGRSRPILLVQSLLRVVPDAESLAPALASAAGRGDQFGRLAIELAGFTRSFAERDVVPASLLSPIQRATAEALVAVPESMLSLRHGLPGSNGAAARWLGLAPPGPLERLEKDKRPRWQHVRDLLASKKTPTAAAVIGRALDGLSPGDQLDVATELLLGAYKVLIQIDATIPPEHLLELVRAAGKEGLVWARRTLTFASDEYQRGRDTYQLSTDHFMMILALLVQAGVALDPAWDALILIDASPESRAVVAALPQSRRDELILDRIAKIQEADDDDKGDFLEEMIPLLDVIGSTRVVEAFRAVFESGDVSEMVSPKTGEALRKARS